MFYYIYIYIYIYTHTHIQCSKDGGTAIYVQKYINVYIRGKRNEWEITLARRFSPRSAFVPLLALVVYVYYVATLFFFMCVRIYI